MKTYTKGVNMLTYNQMIALRYSDPIVSVSFASHVMYLDNHSLNVLDDTVVLKIEFSNVSDCGLPATLLKYNPQISIRVPYQDVTILKIDTTCCAPNVKQELLEYFDASMIS
jgi:hypothetical protein